ncbi:MAG: lipid A-modifier LpxR family protein [Thermonemataceae bacterium]
MIIILELLLCYLCICLSHSLLAQKPATTLELYVDNDFFSIGNRTDRYYTNGLRMAINYTKENDRNRFPDNLLIKYKEDKAIRYSWGLSQAMFTPENIEKDRLEEGDWPYAGGLFVSHEAYSQHPEKNTKIRSGFLLGVLGPWSLAEETQIWFHELPNDPRPNGWDWQIDNYPIINYHLFYETRLLKRKFVETRGLVGGAVGSLINQFNLGVRSRLPLFKRSKFDFSFFQRTNGGYTVYNAYLEGGFWDRQRYERGISRGYRLSSEEINRFYLESQIGVALKYKDWSVAFSQKFRTSQVEGSSSHQVGNITVQIPID